MPRFSAFARANRLGMFVRMAPTGYAQVTQNLEAGADGVMAARLRSAAHAEQFVTWCKFAPRGDRGLNSSGFDARYTFKPVGQLVTDANRDSFVAIQIETLGALEEVDQIAAIEGVDLLFVGPADMSQALGCVGQVNSEKVWEAIDRVAAACRRHNKPWGAAACSPWPTRPWPSAAASTPSSSGTPTFSRSLSQNWLPSPRLRGEGLG